MRDMSKSKVEKEFEKANADLVEINTKTEQRRDVIRALEQKKQEIQRAQRKCMVWSTLYCILSHIITDRPRKYEQQSKISSGEAKKLAKESARNERRSGKRNTVCRTSIHPVSYPKGRRRKKS